MNTTRKPIVIAVASDKGGVTKSTTACFLSRNLAAEGRMTLAIDCDPQGDLATILNVDIAGMPTTEDNIIGAGRSWLYTKVRPSLYLTPSSLLLENVETGLQKTSQPDIKKRVKDKFSAGNLASFDYVVCDCAPALSSFTRAIISNSDYVLIPATPEPMSLKAISRTIECVCQLAGNGDRPKVLGVLFTKNKRLKINFEIIDSVRMAYPNLVLEHTIRDTVLMAAEPFREIDRDPLKRNLAASDYHDITMEILKRIEHE